MPEQPTGAAARARSPAAFARQQLAFAAHIRDPAHQPCPTDVEPRRMAIYRDLFFNNVSSLLKANFPVLHRLLLPEHWQALIRGFLVGHRCATPLFLEIAQEFIDYLGNERGPDPNDPPFLLELAHYEWVELALRISETDPDPRLADPNGDLMTGVPMVSPLAWNLSYRFPVHRIGPEFQPTSPGEQPTHLLVYRNRKDDVEFMEINAVTQRLLQLLQGDPAPTGGEAVQTIAQELQHPNPAQVINAGKTLLQDLRARDVLLGTSRQAKTR